MAREPKFGHGCQVGVASVACRGMGVSCVLFGQVAPPRPSVALSPVWSFVIPVGVPSQFGPLVSFQTRHFTSQRRRGHKSGRDGERAGPQSEPQTCPPKSSTSKTSKARPRLCSVQPVPVVGGRSSRQTKASQSVRQTTSDPTFPPSRTRDRSQSPRIARRKASVSVGSSVRFSLRSWTASVCSSREVQVSRSSSRLASPTVSSQGLGSRTCSVRS